MDDENNSDNYEIYFVAREQDEETEEDMSYDSFSDYNQSNDSSETSEHHQLIDENNESNQTDQEEPQPTSTERRISYNRELPATHSYLGNQFEELTGRVVLEEETYVTIPLLCLPSVILIPGQLLPLQFQGSYFLSTIKDIIDKDKIFGLVPNNQNVNHKNVYNNVKLDRIGTIVEVRSYSTEANGSIVKLKAEGKERFLVKETWTEANRTVMGKCWILSEKDLKHPYHQNLGLSHTGGSKHNKKLLAACTPYHSFIYEMYNPEYLMDKIRSHLNQWASFSTNSKSNNNTETNRRSNVYENRTVSQATGTNQPTTAQTANNTESSNQTNNESTNDETNNSTANVTSSTTESTTANNTTTTTTDVITQPVSVNTTRTVVTRIVPVNDSDEEEDEDSENSYNAPSNPLEFSYWVLSNLPLEDYQRLILLSLDCPIQRLRWQSSFFEKYLSLSCIRCDALICNCEDIFSMSIKGYQDVFVNSHGIVHETLTVTKVNSSNTSFYGRKCDEFSWFPNFSWIIMYCSCSSHLGWKFVANNKNLNPQFFFGISRQSVKPAIANSLIGNSIESPNPVI